MISETISKIYDIQVRPQKGLNLFGFYEKDNGSQDETLHLIPMDKYKQEIDDFKKLSIKHLSECEQDKALQMSGNLGL